MSKRKEKKEEKALSSGGEKFNGKCHVCSDAANKKCAACNNIFYCSADHQKQDWPSHKSNCSAYILKESPEYGRYMVAARKLKPGTTVEFESPVFGGPTMRIEGEFEVPLCLSCCCPMKGAKANYRCTTCRWPVCDIFCEKIYHHSENECSIFARYRVKFPPQGEISARSTYKFIRLMRGILIKEKKPDAWKELMKLQYTTLNEIENYIDHWASWRNALGLDKYTPILNDEEWRRMDGIFRINAFGLNRQEHEKNAESWARFIYLKSSMLAHSCLSNCYWAISYSPSFKFKVSTSFTIPKGEMLTVCYNQDLCLLGTHMRQIRSMEGFGFKCRCVRCRDPTELRTFSSSIICQLCTEGYIHSLDPLVPSSNWKCDHCFSNIPPWVNENLTEDLYYKISEEIEPTDIEALEALNKKLSGIILHPNHWLIQEISRIILIYYSERFSQLIAGQLDIFIGHIEYLLKLRDILSPGISNERGKLHLKLAQCLVKRTEMEMEATKLSKEVLHEKWSFINDLLCKALVFWKEDIANTPIDRICPPEVDVILDKIAIAKKYIRC